MPQLIWSPNSLQNISRLHRFLVVKNPDSARKAVSAIRNAAKMMSRHPFSGRFSGDLPEHFRELYVPFGSSGYVILYRTSDDFTIILAVRHAREAGY